MMNIKLNQREKIVVYGAGLLIVLFLLAQVLISPLFEKREELGSRLQNKRQALAEMEQLQEDYQSLQNSISASMNQFKNRPGDFTLFSFLDRLAGETGIKQHVSYMKPSTTINEETGVNLSRVEMELQAISLEDLTRYLYHVETSENMVMVKRLSISRKEREGGLIDAVLQVETVAA